MKLILVRHAVAEDKESFHVKNSDDDLRPLTSQGKKTFIKDSKMIKKLFPKIDKLFCSPLTRALETADVLESRYGIKKEVIEELRPEREFPELLKVLSKYEKVMLVGHEPHLSHFVGFMIGAQEGPIVLKKGGFCVLDVDNWRTGSAKIASLLSPKILSNFE